MSKSSDKHKITVEHLLRIKKQEKPKPEFWESFESSFEKKRLRALVEKPSIWSRAGNALLKSAYLVVPAAAAYLFSTTFIIHNEPLEFGAESYLVSEVKESLPAEAAMDKPVAISQSSYTDDRIEEVSHADSRFVVDNFSQSNSNTYFRKVMYSSSLSNESESSTGTQYVDNPITRNNSYRVTPAVIKAGYNF